MVRFWTLIAKASLAISLIALLSACQKKTEAADSENELPGELSEPEGRLPHSEGVYESPLMRLSPEQLSKTLEKTLGFSVSWDGGDGRIVDGIVEQFGLPLGGIDFENSSVRDPGAKVQTLLVARLIAWRGAEFIVWKDFERLQKGTSADLKIFEAPFNPWVDLPGEGGERDQIWSTQLENAYWTLLSRAPSAEEKALHKRNFELLAQDENAGVAWISSIYALLGSAEFWNLWGPRTALQEPL